MRTVSIRLTDAMATAADGVVDKHPIEFRCASDFYRTAIKNELERRGRL